MHYCAGGVISSPGGVLGFGKSTPVLDWTIIPVAGHSDPREEC